MSEDYLQFIWSKGYFNNVNLKTVGLELVQVINSGTWNKHEGPDFLQARIKIADKIWVGHVEIHVKSSDWYRHKHQVDRNYRNVILHVVYEYDKQVIAEDRSIIPTLVLSERIDYHHYFSFEKFIMASKRLPCESGLPLIDRVIWMGWKDRLCAHRFERKSDAILTQLVSNKGDWEGLFFELIAKNMGMYYNAEAMLDLAKSIGIGIIRKESFSLIGLEALLFGQAGLLQPNCDDYAQLLNKEYLFLKQKYQLKKPSLSWKFSAIRPSNFPTLRIAQLASIYAATENLFHLIRDKADLSTIDQVLSQEPSAYWKGHYNFGKRRGKSLQTFGKGIKSNLIINAFVPAAMAYGRSTGDLSYIDNAFALLNELPAEKNTIIKKWNGLGVKSDSSFDSQALIELDKSFCNSRKCIQCSIGHKILSDNALIFSR